MNITKQKQLMIIALIEKYNNYTSAGGNLHIILEDGNYQDKDIDFCLKFCKEKNDVFGETLCKHLNEFNTEERKTIIEEPWEIDDYENESD